MRKAPIVMLLLAFTAACSSSTGNGSIAKSGTGSFPVTIQAANGAVTIAKKPAKIVSLAPTSTEVLFAIGAGSQVVAADSLSNYPAGAPKTSLSAYEPNVEAIAKYQPDLVVITNDIKNLVADLNKLSIQVLLEPAANTVDDTYAQIDQLGRATGHVSEASSVVSKMKSDIASIVSAAPHFDARPTYYYELDQTDYTVTSKTFIGSLFALLGLKDIADPADKKASGYPQLSPEFIIEADPTLIFLADTKCCGQSLTTVKKRPGWNQINAVKSGRVIALDDDIASRWGPRIVDLLRTVASALQDLKQAA